METEKINHLTSPNNSHFPIPSLYASLQDEEIHLMEEAFALVMTGAFAEADRAYERLPSQLTSHSIVIICKSIAYLQQWRFRECYAVLEAALSHGADGRKGDEYLLTRTLFAYVNILFRGSFVLARDCMREIRSLIQSIRPEDITDIQVGIFQFILPIVLIDLMTLEGLLSEGIPPACSGSYQQLTQFQ